MAGHVGMNDAPVGINELHAGAEAVERIGHRRGEAAIQIGADEFGNHSRRHFEAEVKERAKAQLLWRLAITEQPELIDAAHVNTS
jgi:hypothetical protein